MRIQPKEASTSSKLPRKDSAIEGCLQSMEICLFLRPTWRIAQRPCHLLCSAGAATLLRSKAGAPISRAGWALCGFGNQRLPESINTNACESTLQYSEEDPVSQRQSRVDPRSRYTYAPPSYLEDWAGDMRDVADCTNGCSRKRNRKSSKENESESYCE